MKSTLRIFALAVALCLIAGAWIKGARDGWYVGRTEAWPQAFAAGQRQAREAFRAQCRPYFSEPHLEARRGGMAVCEGIFSKD